MRTNVASTSKILYVPAVRNASTLNLSTKLPNAARFPVTLVGRPPASQRRSRSRRKETNASPRRTVATQSAETQVSHSPLPFLRQEVAKFAQLAPNVHRLLRLVGISNQEDGSQGFGTRLAASFGSEVLKTLDESSKTEQEILRDSTIHHERSSPEQSRLVFFNGLLNKSCLPASGSVSSV
ncbi:hypothetical protein BT69DRAFT_195612 [Atractiella rhizophila]|nr:hypothetical protein BT69DRAFT_195612 [Atractiella rhizophila]